MPPRRRRLHAHCKRRRCVSTALPGPGSHAHAQRLMPTQTQALVQGCIVQMYHELKKVDRPVLQLGSVSELPDSGLLGCVRFLAADPELPAQSPVHTCLRRVLLSDGAHFGPGFMSSELFSVHKLKECSIVKLTKYKVPSRQEAEEMVADGGAPTKDQQGVNRALFPHLNSEAFLRCATASPRIYHAAAGAEPLPFACGSSSSAASERR